MRKIAVLAGALMFCGAAFAADPQLVNLVMPGAKMLAGVNVTNARISPLGQFVLLQIESKQTGLQGLKTAAGFDPLHDVTEVLAASAGDPGTPGGLILMRGTFQPDQILEALKKSKIVTETHAGYTVVIFTGKKDKAKAALAFLGTTIAVAGDLSSVEAALDRSGSSNSLDPALMVQVNKLSGANDAWFTSSVALSALPMPSAPPQVSQFLKNVQGFSGGIRLGSDVLGTVEIVADTPQNATALGDVAKLGISLASMNAGTDPKMTAGTAVAPDFTDHDAGHRGGSGFERSGSKSRVFADEIRKR